jgi:DNA-binding response OmpR family regulator
MKSARVLLVDGDSCVLRLLEAVFRRRGVPVRTAGSGEAALALVQEDPPDLIIADVVLPGMGGLELCRRVRALQEGDLHFIFCSALGGTSDRVAGLRAGADDYLVKPVDTSELVLRASGHLERLRQVQRLRQLQPDAPHSAAEVLNGRIGGLAVADVLQVAALLRRKPVVVRLGHLSPDEGAVWLEGSRLVAAQSGADTGRRALLRLLDLVEGCFRIEEEAYPGEPPVSELLDEAILQGLAELDELRALRESLPGPRLCVQQRGRAVRRRFDAASAEVLSLVELEPQVAVMLRSSPLPEIETLRALASLLAEGFLAQAA